MTSNAASLSTLVPRLGILSALHRVPVGIGSALLTRWLLLCALLYWLVSSFELPVMLMDDPHQPWQQFIQDAYTLATRQGGLIYFTSFFTLVLLYGYWRYRQISTAITLEADALCFGGKQPRCIPLTQIRSLRPVSPFQSWLRLATPGLHPRLLSRASSLAHWYELRLHKGSQRYLFACSDNASRLQLQHWLILPQDMSWNEFPSGYRLPLLFSGLLLLLIGLAFTVFWFTVFVVLLYGAWRWFANFLRSRKLAAQRRATQRLSPVPAAQRRSSRLFAFARWMHGLFAALLLQPVRGTLYALRYCMAILCILPWRRLGRHLLSLWPLSWLALLALIPAVAVGFWTSSLPQDLFTSPEMMRALLARAPIAQRPVIATQALELAQQRKQDAIMRAVILGGAQAGRFPLQDYQGQLRAQQQCRSALPQLSLPVRFELIETLTSQELAQLARCARDPRHLQLSYGLAAFQRQKGVGVDAHLALQSANAELLAFALDHGADLEQRDWRGRTPLLAVMDMFRQTLSTFAMSTQEKAKDLDAYNQMRKLLLMRGAKTDVVDQAGRSAAYLGIAIGLSDDFIEGYLKQASPAYRTSLGETQLHAVAASGKVSRAKQVLALGTPLQARTVDGRSALHFAKEEAMVWYLIGLGLDPALPDVRGQTPLHHAVQHRDLAAASALGRISGTLDAVDLFGQKPFDYAPAPETKPDDLKTGNSSKKKGALKPAWAQWRELEDSLRRQIQ